MGHCGRVFPRCGRGRDKEAAATTADASNTKSRAAFESQSSDRIAESDVAEDTMSAMLKLANGGMPIDDALREKAGYTER